MKKTIYILALLTAFLFCAANADAQTSRGLGVPYPTNPSAMEKEVNKLIAIADIASTCDDARAYVKQLNYVVNNGGALALATAHDYVVKADNAIAELDKSLGGCSTTAEMSEKKTSRSYSAAFWSCFLSTEIG